MERAQCVSGLEGIAAVLIFSLAGRAQEPAGEAVIDEIVVTAQKREHPSQDVPVGLAAVNGDFLQSAAIDWIETLPRPLRRERHRRQGVLM